VANHAPFQELFVKKNRLYWASRRGMLELDLILKPFLDNHFDDLDLDDQKRYEALLEEQDPDLFQWFLKGAEPEHPDLKRIIGIILDKVAS